MTALQPIVLLLLIFCVYLAEALNEDSVLIAGIPDPIPIVSTPQPTMATNASLTTMATEIFPSSTENEINSLHSIIMLLILGCSVGILLSICFAACVVSICHAKTAEPMRIFQQDGNRKQSIQKRELSSDLKKLSPRLSPPEMSLDFKLPPQQTKMVNAPETMCSVKVECETPNEANMGLNGSCLYILILLHIQYTSNVWFD